MRNFNVVVMAVILNIYFWLLPNHKDNDETRYVVPVRLVDENLVSMQFEIQDCRLFYNFVNFDQPFSPMHIFAWVLNVI